MANKLGAEMQAYNSEITKCRKRETPPVYLTTDASRDVKGIDELKATRANLQEQIDAEENEKEMLLKEVERMSCKIEQLNESLRKKAAICTDYDRTIEETESAYTKILESSQLLLNMVKREVACLDQSLYGTHNAERI